MNAEIDEETLNYAVRDQEPPKFEFAKRCLCARRLAFAPSEPLAFSLSISLSICGFECPVLLGF